MIDLYVINYNTCEQLKRLLYHLHSSRYANIWKLYIADNGSTDDTRAWWAEYGNRYQVERFISNENIGYAAAANQLAAKGTGEIIGILNADIWFTQDDLLQIQKAFDEDPSIAILGPKQRNEQGYVTAGGIFGTNTNPQHRGWQVYDPEDKLYRDRLEAVTVSGSAYFIRRSVWNNLTNCPIYQGLEVVKSNEWKGAFLPTPHYY